MILAFTGAGISKASGIDTFMERPEVRNILHRSYAQRHPDTYNKEIRDLTEAMREACPNDAHIALFEYEVSIITMNIDGLHEKAGSSPLCLHGSLPDASEMGSAHTLIGKPVLYGDPAPNYEAAYRLVDKLTRHDIFLVVGASYHTAVAHDLRVIAKQRGAKVVEIQENSVVEVRRFLEEQNGST